MSKRPVDVHVGQKIRHRRWLAGMTQQQLAAACGIKFQQVQKYESGANRVSASRLWDIARALDVPVAYFFEGLEGGATEMPEAMDKGTLEIAGRIDGLPGHQRQAIVRLLHALTNEPEATDTERAA